MPHSALQPVLDSPNNRMLTYITSDSKGAKVIVSVRAEIANDDLVRDVMEMLSAPRYRA